jgi:hypothetical protein
MVEKVGTNDHREALSTGCHDRQSKAIVQRNGQEDKNLSSSSTQAKCCHIR